jgi:hypothetical protein
MRDEMKAAGDANSAGGCDRFEELVAYLYAEARPSEEREFRAHLEACTTCREELSAFGGVRRSIALWRAEAESHAPALDAREALATAGRIQAPEFFTSEPDARATFAPNAAAPRRSARAALREFLTLSPLWLRAGVAAATLVVCALAALTIVRGEVAWDDKGLAFRAIESGSAPPQSRPAGESTNRPEAVVYTQEQVEAIVAERVAREVAAARERFAREERREAPAVASAGEESKQSPGGATRTQAPRVVAAADRGAGARRAPAIGVNKRRDAVAGADEESLPRLSDLLGGVYD